MSIAGAREAALSPLGLGCARVGSFNNPRTMAESRALIERAMELGLTTLDTSNIYGQGDSERTIGRVLQGRREDAFVVTKTGRGFSAKMRFLRPFKPILRPLLATRGKGGASDANAVTARRDDAMRFDWSPDSFAPSLHASLRRLRTDHVDGFLLHSPPPRVAADPRVGEALAVLKQAGKVRHFGVSCDDYAGLSAALTMDGLTLLQLPWDVIAALPDDEALAIRNRGCIVLAREVIRAQPALSPVEAVRAAAAHPIVASALVGTTSLAHLEALAAAMPSPAFVA
ncbi:aldo/keto reductase [Stakelama sp. CBK3Z-3]|uniref:Aldo/keto reductase n=1 Tax=Stakelama flava TaxID=2860338 RepID=A0ABS6XI92_9SPHN|nr:aldo/keto reductase [Stakelama flava]MBW4329919.1 aldo/keto reductase [Stakelama flava]